MSIKKFLKVFGIVICSIMGFVCFILVFGSFSTGETSMAITALILTVLFGIFVYLIKKSLKGTSKRTINKLEKKENQKAENPNVKKCQFCKSEIDFNATVCPVCKKQLVSVKIAVIATLITILFFAIIIGTIASSINLNSADREKAKNTIHEIKETVKLNKTDITINGITMSSEKLDDLWVCGSNEEYMLVNVGFVNTGKNDHTYSKSNFDLVVGENKNIITPTVVNGDDELSSQAVASSGKLDTKVRFCIPKGDDTIFLRYQYDWLADKIQFKVR